MKILFVLSALSAGGQERQLAELAPGLVRKGHEVDVAVAYPGDYFEPILISKGINVKVLRSVARDREPGILKRMFEITHRVRALRKLVRQGHYDVVHGYGDIANVYASLSAFRPGHAVIWGIRASESLVHGVAAWFVPLLSRQVDLVICNSQAGADQILRDGYRPKKVVVIPNGIDVERCNIDEEAGCAVRRELGVGQGEKLVGIIGNLHPRKGLPAFIHSAALLAPRIPAKFLILGSDYKVETPKLMELATSLGIAHAIIRKTVVSDVERYMNALDVLVSASTTEGFSNVIAEGMACGVPCVVTDVGDSALIVGKLGEIVPPGNPEALAAAIEAVVNGKYRDRQAIRASITERFSIDVLVERSEAAMTAVLR